MGEKKLIESITANRKMFEVKCIIRRRRLAIERVVGMPAAGDAQETMFLVVECYSFDRWPLPERTRAI